MQLVNERTVLFMYNKSLRWNDFCHRSKAEIPSIYLWVVAIES